LPQAYRDLAKRHPSFRERSETTDLIVEISLQPWKSFKPDGVILFRWADAGGLTAYPCSAMRFPTVPNETDAWRVDTDGVPTCCSDILTPLPALGMPFEIDDMKGPIIEQPIRCGWATNSR